MLSTSETRMLSLRELLAYGKVFLEEESLDSGNEWDLEAVDRWEAGTSRVAGRSTAAGST